MDPSREHEVLPRDRRLSTFIRERQAEVLDRWERIVRQLPVARDLARPALIDHLPDLLDRIAKMADELAAGGTPRLPPDLAEIHATERLDEGFDLGQVVTEYAVLRDCIIDLWSEHAEANKGDTLGVRALNQAIDKAVGASVQRYTVARDRTLQSLDRISAAALETRSLEEFLDRLLHVLLETTAAVDSATILLLDGDILRVRASVGLGEHANNFALRIGEGFAGMIAETRCAKMVHSGSADPTVLNPALREKGVKALFGIPLIEGSHVIGVAIMGSVSASEFSRQDQHLFTAMGHRATAAIFQHMLRDAAEWKARQQLAVATLGVHALATRDPSTLLEEAVLTVKDTFGAELASVLQEQPDGSFRSVADSGWGPLPPDTQAHAGYTLHAGQPIILDNVASETRFDVPAVLRERGIHSGICAPIPLPGERAHTYGVICAYTVQRRAFSRDDTAFLQSLAHVVGNAIALREREAQFRTLADNIPQLSWMADETGSIFWFNGRWFEFTGTTLDEMQGWGWQKVHHPEHLDHVREKYRHHIESGEVWEDTFPLRGKDGTYRWFLSRAVPVRDEHGKIVRWLGTNTDVTEQRFMIEATMVLSSSLDYHQTLERIAQLAVPALGDWCGVDLVDDRGGIERVAVTHTDPAKVDLAREFARKYPPDLNAAHGVPNVIRTGTSEMACEIPDELLVKRARDPEHLAMVRSLGLKSYMVVPLVARGRTLGAISLVSAESGRCYDTNDLELAEELGRRAGLAVDNARLFAEAQRESRMREEVLAVVSHDLKNPLGAIHLAATLLLERPEFQNHKHLKTIDRAASRMDHLIGDLLDMASVQAGRLSIEKRAEDVEPLVREVVDLHEPMAKEKGITLVRATDLQGTKVCCDRDRLMQVFGNLIGNAIKFCRERDTITIRGERDGACARFAVVDTGPGISKDELDHIFEPYWSAKQHAKKGTGLGLFISKGIVEALGGQLWAESEVGNGAAFYFTVPFA